MDIYSELPFLQEFYESTPLLSSEKEKSKIWIKYDEFLDSNLSIVIDADEEDLNRYSNDDSPLGIFLNTLLLSYNENRREVVFQKNMFESFDFSNDNPRAIFFLHNKRKCVKLGEKYKSRLFLSFEDIYKNVLVKELHKNITPKEFPFKNWEKHPWDGLKQFKHPCSQIIIADNYIFDKKSNKNNNEDLIQENLLKILHYLLPEPSSKIKFDLLIITDGYKIEKRCKKFKYDFKEIYKYINNTLKGMGYQFSLEIVFNAKSDRHKEYKNHGRNIITNYFKIHCDHSFSMFTKMKCTINAEFYIKSILDKTTRQSIFSLEEQYKEIQANANNLGYEIVKLSE